MGLRRNSLELATAFVKFVLSDFSDLACHTINVPSLCFHQAAEAIRGGWSANEKQSDFIPVCPSLTKWDSLQRSNYQGRTATRRSGTTGSLFRCDYPRFCESDPIATEPQQLKPVHANLARCGV
jgi:hypothetical protein